MSQSPALSALTRRELQQLTAAQLRTMATEHALPSSGRKSALVDRIYRHQHQPQPDSRDRSPTRTPVRSPSAAAESTSDLQQSVERLVQNSIRGLEARLLRTLRPLAATTAPDNISLPSPAPATALAAPTDRPLAPGLGTENATSQAAQHPPLPDRMKQRILRGEYIEFDSLLPESLYPARYGASPSPAFTLRLSNDPSAETGDVVIAQQKPASKRSIADLPAWMEAWNLYAQVLVASFPERASSLLAYQAIICSASVRFAPRCWLRYDHRFRASAAADSTIRWDIKHNELWLECFTQSSLAPHTPPSASSKPSRRPCTYCGSFYHYPENCPAHPFRASRTRTSPPTAPQPPSRPAHPVQPQSTSVLPQAHSEPLPHPCRDFNNGTCLRRICRFRHICSRCGDQSHRERECPAPRWPVTAGHPPTTAPARARTSVSPRQRLRQSAYTQYPTRLLHRLWRPPLPTHCTPPPVCTSTPTHHLRGLSKGVPGRTHGWPLLRTSPT